MPDPFVQAIWSKPYRIERTMGQPFPTRAPRAGNRA
jgi:hypothetical protein